MKEYRVELFCFQGEVYDKNETNWVPLEQLNFSHEFLKKLQEIGIIETRGEYVRSEHIPRIFKVLRLRKTLGINFTGAAVIMELLDKIDDLQEEIETLKKQLR